MTTVNTKGAYRATIQSGLVTTVAAATASAGHIFSMRYVNTATNAAMKLVALEVEFILTTAFGAAQEVGFDVVKGISYSASPTGATAVTIGANDAKKRASFCPSSDFSSTGDVRVANTGAMTVGTVTLLGQPFAQGSYWAGSVGSVLGPRRFDFTATDPGGILFANNEGFIIRNSILMGATGVGRWTFSVEWDEVIAHA